MLDPDNWGHLGRDWAEIDKYLERLQEIDDTTLPSGFPNQDKFRVSRVSGAPPMSFAITHKVLDVAAREQRKAILVDIIAKLRSHVKDLNDLLVDCSEDLIALSSTGPEVRE